MIREEGHYTLKRVKELPKKGNHNILYAFRTECIEALYRWLPNGTYERLKLGTAFDIQDTDLDFDDTTGILTATFVDGTTATAIIEIEPFILGNSDASDAGNGTSVVNADAHQISAYEEELEFFYNPSQNTTVIRLAQAFKDSIPGNDLYEEVCYEGVITNQPGFVKIITASGGTLDEVEVANGIGPLDFRVDKITYDGVQYTPTNPIYIRQAGQPINNLAFGTALKTEFESLVPGGITLPPASNWIVGPQPNHFPAGDSVAVVDDGVATVDYDIFFLHMLAFAPGGTTSLGGRIDRLIPSTINGTTIEKGYKFVDVSVVPHTFEVYDFNNNLISNPTLLDCPISFNDLVDIPSDLGEHEGYNETGTRAGGDLVVSVGDYDNSGNGTAITITDDNEVINLNADSDVEVYAPFVRIGESNNQELRVDNSGSSLEVILHDASTANPTLTFGSGAGTATFRTVGNISLNQDVSGSNYKLRTYNAATTALLDRLIVTGRIDESIVSILNSDVGVNVVGTPERKMHIADSFKPLLAENTNGTTFEVVEVRTDAAGSYVYFVDTNTTYVNGVQIGSRGDEFVINTQGIERVRVDEDGNVGIGTNNPLFPLDMVDLARFRDGTRIEARNSNGNGIRHYQSVVDYVNNATAPGPEGSIIINTNIPRDANEMAIVDVKGYAYGDQKMIDFSVVFYAWSGAPGQDAQSGAPINYSIIDRGDDTYAKFLGINAAGNIAIAYDDFDGPGKYIYRFVVDYYQTNQNNDTLAQNWSVENNTTDGFGWLHLLDFTDGFGPTLKQRGDVVTIGGRYDGGSQLTVNHPNSRDAFQIVNRDDNSNFSIDTKENFGEKSLNFYENTTGQQNDIIMTLNENHNVGVNIDNPLEKFHVNGTIRQQTPNNDASINWGIADFHDGTNIALTYYHIRVPYIFQTSPPYNADGGQNHWHVHVTGSSNGADTAIDIRYMGFLFSPNGIFNNSETIEHNNPGAGKGVLGAGSYISATDNALVLWFQLESSNQTRFRVDSMMAGTSGNILQEGDLTITATTSSTI